MSGGLKIERDQPDDHTRLIFAEGKINEALHHADVARSRANLAIGMTMIALLLGLAALIWR